MKGLREKYAKAVRDFRDKERSARGSYKYSQEQQIASVARDLISEISKEIGDDFITCKVCGKIENVRGLWAEGRIERWESELCHTCDYWTERITSKDEPWSIRIDGQQYVDGGKTDGPKRFKGLGGDTHIFRLIDKKMRQYIVTDNLWVNGDIPERFKGQLPDNCERVEFKDWKERELVLKSLL